MLDRKANGRVAFVARHGWCAFFSVVCAALLSTALPGRAVAGEGSVGFAAPELINPKGPLYTVARPEGGFWIVTRSDTGFQTINTLDEARAWHGGPPGFRMPEGEPPSDQMLLDREGNVHALLMKARGEGARPAVDFFIDILHSRTENNGRTWSRPSPVFNGYVGALLDLKALATGRIVVPFAYWVSGLTGEPPVGSNRSTTVVSDDGGATWSKPEAALVSPCRAGFNGDNYGAVEPVILPLTDGRLWMLLRTQTGFLYESFSLDGVSWSSGKASRFHSSDSPAAPVRLPDGRMVVCWNNCEMPPRFEGQGVYGGRDALHAAISDDGGRTWQGFREIYRDLHRNETPPRTGDRGTAYPVATFSRDGKVFVIAGQGEGRRNIVVVDPGWLTATEDEDDFSHGLERWSAFKEFGPASGWWRDRCEGPVLIEHPDKPGAKALHLRRSDDKSPDAAVWNFPNGRKGVLSLNIMLMEGFAGANITLNNRFFNPGDEAAERQAMFALYIPADGLVGVAPRLAPGQFHRFDLAWDLDQHECEVRTDGAWTLSLPLRNQTDNGISYVRLSSATDHVDSGGFLVEYVRVAVTEPRTLPINLRD